MCVGSEERRGGGGYTVKANETLRVTNKWRDAKKVPCPLWTVTAAPTLLRDVLLLIWNLWGAENLRMIYKFLKLCHVAETELQACSFAQTYGHITPHAPFIMGFKIIKCIKIRDHKHLANHFPLNKDFCI